MAAGHDPDIPEELMEGLYDAEAVAGSILAIESTFPLSR